MTNILTFDLENFIENSIIELNKKIREDITNNLLRTLSKESIYELDDIKDFGKLSDPTLSNIYNFIKNKYSIYSNLELLPYHFDYLKLYEGEYPILICNEINNSSRQITYITNIIDGLMLNNDDILFLILIAIKINKKRKQPIYRPCNTVIKYLKENNFIDTESDNECILNNSLKRYFASIHYIKIKAFEFDKLIKNNKLLEDEKYDIHEEKNILLDKIIKLEEENYIFFKELIKLKELNLEKQNKTYEEYYKIEEDKIIKLEEENNNLLDKIIKLEETNSIYFKNIIDFEEEYEQKIFNESKIIIELNDKLFKTKEKLDKTKEKNNNLLEDNNKLIETINKVKEKNNQQKIITSNLVEDNNKLLDKIIKLEETNSIYFKNIIDFEEEYEQKIFNESKIIIELNDKLFKTKEKLDKTKEKNNNLLEDNNKLIETINKVKEKNNQQKIITSNLVEDNNKLVKDNNKLVEVTNKLKETNTNLVEDNNKLKETNTKLIEYNSNLVEDNNNLVEDKKINNKEIKEKIYNIEKEHEKIIEENKNTHSLMTKISKDTTNENIKTINERQKLINKIVDLMEEKNKLVKIINILSDKNIYYLTTETDINDNLQQILLDIKEERNNIHIENNRLKNLNNKLETNEINLLIDYDPIIKKYKKIQREIITFYNLIICLIIFYLF